MANDNHFARLQQGVVNILAKTHQDVAAGAAYVCAWAKTWITGRQAGEAIRCTRQQVMAHLHFTRWQEIARQYLPLLVALGVLLLLPFFFWKLPQWYAASWDELTEAKDIVKLESDTRTTMVQAVGGIALLVGLWFTWRNLRMTEQNSRQTLDLSRKGQINDRFIKAIEQLGAVDQGGRKKLEIRLGGIYALEQIGKDSPDDHHWPIMEILTAYVRETASWKEGEQPSQEDLVPSETQPPQSHQSQPQLAPDIQAILTVLGRRTRTYGQGEDQRLNLGNTDLRGAELQGVHLKKAILQGAHLERANLQEAHLEEAILLGAHLKRAILRGAHLQEATLADAHLQGADLFGAHLQDTYLGDAHLEGATLRGTHLERANLYRAHLQGATLQGTYLRGADLHGADLRRARSLTVEQLSTVSSLYEAQLDPLLLEDIQRLYPQLL